MNNSRKSYQNSRWHEFANKVKHRDNYTCLSCGRNNEEVVLQVHHQRYYNGRHPWDYPLSDCITLCKGCHSQKHGLVEPSKGWIIDSIEDLGDLVGACERKGCGNTIRHGYNIYHPNWGYKTVGSTCVEYLTQEDRYLGQAVVKVFDRVSKFVNESYWDSKRAKSGNYYLVTTYSHHQVRIYGKDGRYAFQIALKRKGEKWFDFKEIIPAHGKTLDEVKELGFIVVKGLTTTDKEEKSILQNIYRRMR